ncbi:FAD-binding domain-containing protein [Dendrothele bispora CBS 962.96]|uniref:FAD-binding domain-containing protein n=1 Tax=Dendrothele bispora (strain CBS 962.96) TaxID=1314807 RepID=A0A4S8MRC5_DENBC|nr:FAD-binding domain-containing protein [Dendrothele bispora CBS 962.96]
MAQQALPPFPEQFQGDFVTPKDPDYAKAISRWAKTAERNAAIVAFVKSSSDVTLALEYARKAQLPIAICGGGHSPAGASSIEEGLVIDLSRYINYSKVDPDKKLAYVGGGALWEAVDRTAIEHGLATVGGTVNHVRAHMLTIGGGYGWLSGMHGMAVDNLIQATVVTADGSTLTANEDENSDLFWAIRGGGSNFGVCTEFVFKLHPQRRTVYAGSIIYPFSALKDVVQTTESWRKNIPSMGGMIQFFTMGPDGQPALAITLFYNGSEAEGRSIFKDFFNLGPIADFTAEIPFEELNALQNDRTQHGSCIYQKGVAQSSLDYPSLKQAFDKVIELSSGNDDFGVVLVFEYFNLDQINSVSPSKTAFRRDPTNTILINFVWKENTPANLQRARAGAKELADIIGNPQAQLGVTKSQIQGYTNYGMSGMIEAVTDKAQLVFGQNYPRLQQIKKKYDPTLIFCKWFPIKPAP